MRVSNKARLFAGTATAACAIALGSSPASAQCVASTATVTCTGATTVSNANTAIAGATPPSVAITVQTGATVTADAQNTIQPSGATFNGAVSLANAGTLGTTAAPVNFLYFGTPTAATNTFGLTNSGTVTGYVQALNLGGAITANNTGVIAGGLFLSGSGPITLTSSGPIYVANGGSGSTAVNLSSSQTTSATTGTVGVDAVTTQTTSGGLVSATITGPIAIPAIGTTATVPQNIFLSGIGGAQLNLNALAGFVTVRSTGGGVSSFIPGAGNGSTTGGVTTVNNANSFTNAGGAAAATIGADAQIAGLTVQSGPAAASASIAGKVGSTTTGGSVSVTSTAADTSFTSTQTTSPTGTTFASTNRSTPVGGPVSADIAATGQVFGGVTVNGNKGAATVTVAGTTGSGTGTTITQTGDVNATSQGQSFLTQVNNSSAFATGDFSNVSITTRAATGSTSAVTVASTGNVFGGVSATGDAGASIDNAGRIRNNASVTSSVVLTTTNDTRSSQATTTAGGGATTVVQTNTNNFTNTAIGGTASLTNRATGTIGDLLGDNVNVSGLGGASITNTGAIFGGVNLTSSNNIFTSTNTNSTSTTSGGGAATVVVTTSTGSSSNTPAGGAVTGAYGGTVGAVSSSTLGGFRTVNQTGQSGSTATISGTLLADFNGNAGAATTTSSNTNTTTTTTQLATAPATPASETVSTGQNRNASTYNSANSAVTVTGQLVNNGFGTGNLTVGTTSGAATAAVNGGTVAGNISVTGGSQANTTSGSDTASRGTVAATTAGPVPAAVAQSSSTTNFNTSQGAAGTAALTLTGATVNGGVSVSGRGTGAGSTAASLNLSSDSTVAGGVTVSSNFSADSRFDSSDVSTRGTGTPPVTRTVSSSNAQGVPTNYGNATATLAGKSGSVAVSSSFGAASATLTGQTTGGVSVTAAGTLSNGSSQTSYSGANATSLTATTLTAFSSNSSFTNAGGPASLAINSASTLQTTATSATSGFITVQGVGGSTLTVAAGLRVNGGTSAGVSVGNSYFNTASQQTNTYNATGVQTGFTTTNTSTAVGGAASVTNAGLIGSIAAFVPVSVQSVGGAAATNSATIYGSVSANALALNSSTTTTETNTNDAVLLRRVATTTNTGVGGAASVTNSGVITGGVSLAGATGTLTNSGVLRGTVSLGQAVSQYAVTTTSTPTSVLTLATAPTARFAQTYTVNQNGLLIGGVSVGGVGFGPATVANPSTVVTPATVTLRTSDVTATINLNAGSTTLGNITAQTVSATDNTRLTNTTLRLNDSGFLGVGYPDLTNGLLGTGTGTLKFVNTPNYGAYLATDPALGTLTGTVFNPNILLPSGSRVTGVTLVEKTGAGVFTIVGGNYFAPTNSNAVAQYTMDVGTFRNSAGEVQLGVIGTDVNGASVFAIRGNVENNATLTLGRRVTDGATSVLQGLAVRVDGNVTQGATGTLALAAAPALIRQNATVTGPLVAPGILGFGGYGIALPAFVAYDPTNTSTLRSMPSSLAVNGNLTLAGAVAVTTTPGAIYTAGRNQDLFTVSGTYSATGVTLNPGFTSPFLTFALTPRTVGTATVVSLDVSRAAYGTVTTNSNAASAAGGLQAAIPNVVSRITAITNPAGVTDVQNYGRLQDLATVISGLDTRLSAADAATAFNQLASASFYGSLQAISTTAPFGESTDQLPLTAPAGIGLWFRPTGQFARIDGRASTGAARLRYDNYGGSGGFSVSTGNGGYLGVGGGYGRINTHPAGYPAKATADTYMVGAFGGYRFAGVNLGAQAVFGWSNWDASRVLPIFSRTATANFDSKEFRFTARAGYDFNLGQAVVTPFAKIDVRHYTFDAFAEDDAGGIGLAVGKRSKTVTSPELGVRLAGDFAGIQPFVEGSYIFQSKVQGYKNVSYLGDPSTLFTLQGVDPRGHAKLGGGIQADVYGATVYLRGNYLTGGRVSTGEAQGGLVIRF